MKDRTNRTTGDANLPTRDKERNTEGEAIKNAVDSEEKARASQIKSNLHTIGWASEYICYIKNKLAESATEISDELMIVKAEKRKLEDELLVTEKKTIENTKSMQEAHEKALGMATTVCKKVEQNLHESEKERLALQNKLLSAGKAAADNKRKMEANQAQLEQAKEDSKRVRDQLHQVETNLVGMEAKFVTSDAKVSTLQVEKIVLEKWCQSIQSALSKEQEKSLCEICMESQKDTICLPCLHLRYCFGCLEKHRERARTCPCCRTIISGVLRSDIGMCGN